MRPTQAPMSAMDALQGGTLGAAPMRNMTSRPRKLVAQALAAMDCVMRESRSQSEEDRMLLPTLLRAANHRPGRFLEMGAFNGIMFSNTMVLERCYAWDGVLIEASAANYAKLIRSGRRATMVHSAVCEGNGTDGSTVELMAGGTYPYVSGESSVMSAKFRHRWFRGRRASTERVPCQSLTSLLATHAPSCAGKDGCFAFLSLDVEGAEEKVLAHAQPSAFSLIMVESDGSDLPKERRIQRQLVRAGFSPSSTLIKNSRVYESAALAAQSARLRAGDAPAAAPFAGAASPPPLRLPFSVPGYCGVTSSDPGNCSAGQSGSWPVGVLRQKSRGAVADVSGCLERCAGCQNCNFLTVSLVDLECSWFLSCPLPLQTAWAADHHTVRIARGRREAGRPSRQVDASFAPEWEKAGFAMERAAYGRRGLAMREPRERQMLGYPAELRL